MTIKTSSSSQKTRDAALRALVAGGLTVDQVSALKLNQVHLATGTVVIEPDEFAEESSPPAPSLTLKLDQEMQRTLIAWLVTRPDGPNDHVFPGTELEGLDVATIQQAIAPTEAKEPPEAAKPSAVTTPPDVREKVTGDRIEEPAPEPPAKPKPDRPAVEPTVEKKVPTHPPAAPQEKPQSVSLDQIAAMRKRLGEVYDKWTPVVPKTAGEPVSAPPRADDEQVTEPEAPPLEVGKPTPTPEPAPRLDKAIAPKRPTAKEKEIPIPVERPSPVEQRQWNLLTRLRKAIRSKEERVTIRPSYRIMAIGGATLLVICCIGLAVAGGALWRAGGPASLLAGVTPTETPAPTTEEMPSSTPVATTAPSPTPIPPSTETPSVTATLADTPSPLPTTGPTPTPIIIVVTATSTPEPPATATPVPTERATGGTPAKPTATATSTFKYNAPVLLEPEDGGVVPGVYAFLKWEPVGPLAADEWYAVRLVFNQQGQPSYQGDRVKVPEWRVPERFYYQADGPALEYRWHVFVERENPDGTTTQLSPESETVVFRWQ